MRPVKLVIAAVACIGALALGSGCTGVGSRNTETSDGRQVLRAMYIGGTSDKDVIATIQKAVDKFNSENKYNAKVEIETYENEQYKTKLASLMASNSQPDIFFTWSSGYLKPFVDGGKILELTPYLEKDKEWKERFKEGVFGPVTFNDKIYAVPHGQAVATMFYNKKIFAEKGLEIPSTYEQFIKTVKKLKESDVIPISAPVKDAWIAGQLMQQLANIDGGMNLFENTISGKTKWNDQAYVNAANRLKELTELGAFPDGYLGMTNDEGRNLFTEEKAAMYYMGSWDMNILADKQNAVAANLGAFNIPPVQDGGENVAVGDVDLAYAISADTTNPEAAIAYLKLFSDKEIQESFAYDAAYLIATKTSLDDAKLQPIFTEVAKISDQIAGITPWFDRVFGAGEGVEFNNAAQAIIAGGNPEPRLDELNQFAKDNSER